MRYAELGARKVPWTAILIEEPKDQSLKKSIGEKRSRSSSAWFRVSGFVPLIIA